MGSIFDKAQESAENRTHKLAEAEGSRQASLPAHPSSGAQAGSGYSCSLFVDALTLHLATTCVRKSVRAFFENLVEGGVKQRQQQKETQTETATEADAANAACGRAAVC